MNRRGWLCLTAAVAVATATVASQQQFPTAGMAQDTMVVRANAVTVKVSAIKGLVYP
ncbi:MAG: hypothetical protein AB7N65_23565 [Vicinamibacterales bacterium]